MRKFLTCISLFSSMIIMQSWAQFQDKDINRYIDTYKDLAIAEQVKNKVPAAIKLAQGLYETAAGTSELANNAYNHFGIKCKSNWSGESYTYDDDRKDECFRKYQSHEASYVDHSQFLIQNKRYAPLFELSVLDYKGWAKQLKKSGYATNPAYAEKLIEIIEKYNLNQYSEMALYNAAQNPELIAGATDKPSFVQYTSNTTIAAPAKVTPEEENNYDYYRVLYLHGLKGFYAKKDDMLLNQAIKHKIRYATLLNYNDLKDEPLPYDMFIYLENKKKTGDRPHIVVGKNQTLHYISQAEGIQLEQLRNLNKLDVGEEPADGASLNLQSPIAYKPNLRGASMRSTANNSNSINNNPVTKAKDDGVVKIVDEEILNQSQNVDEEEEEEELLTEAVDPNDEPVEEVVEIEQVVTGPPAKNENFRIVNNETKKAPEENKINNNTVAKGSNNIAQSNDQLEQLKKKMDRSVYSDQDAIPVQKSAYTKGVELADAKGTNYENKVPPPNSEVNRTNRKNPEPPSKKSDGKDPNIAFKEHMKKVKSGLAPAYFPKSTGVAHTVFAAPAAPKKVVAAAPKNSSKKNAKNDKKSNTTVAKSKNKKSEKTVAANKKSNNQKQVAAKKSNNKQTAQKVSKPAVKKKK